MREMGYLRNDKTYTSNKRLKKSRKAGQKQAPQEFCGVLFIPGGDGIFDGIRYDKYGVFAGNFYLFAVSIFVHYATVPPLLQKILQKQQGI